jgi:hypothetical protein
MEDAVLSMNRGSRLENDHTLHTKSAAFVMRQPTFSFLVIGPCRLCMSNSADVDHGKNDRLVRTCIANPEHILEFLRAVNAMWSHIGERRLIRGWMLGPGGETRSGAH